VILGVGTVALDTVETPTGSAREMPGGSALYFAAAASGPGPVAVVGVTGEDFPAEALERLARRGVDVSGILRVPHPTFRWHARYDASGNREIVSVHKGGIVGIPPHVPSRFRNPDVLFLGSTDPHVQSHVLESVGGAETVVLDTMTHWIRDDRDTLEALLAHVDILLASEEEVRALGGSDDEATAAEAARALGPAWVVVKRGARGSCAYGGHGAVEVEAVGVDTVVDPTGAGDAFAGGLVSSLAAAGSLSAADMREALDVATEMGARAVRAYSFQGILGGGERSPRTSSPHNTVRIEE
jgi:sugar/nucleoside kinase (ribokinase family)